MVIIMAKIKLNLISGDCITKKVTYTIDKTGLIIECNRSKEYCYLKNNKLDTLNALPTDGIVCEKVGLFKKQPLTEITVIQCSKREFSTKGFTGKMHFDSGYSNAITDIKIPFEISFKIDSNNVEKFIDYAYNNSYKNNIDFNDLYEGLELHVNNAIKEVIGESGIYSIEDLETNSLEWGEEILEVLNNSKKVTSTGLIFTNISIQIVDDMMHRAEKKRVQHNKILTK